MKWFITLSVAIAVLVLVSCEGSADTGIKVEKLRCEYLANPLGIDAAKPRLSWILKSEQRGQVQTAYQILVASDEASLKQDKGDLWDSGKIESNKSVHIVYAGAPLKSRMRCWWKVRVWDKDGKSSAWSQTAWWEMGLLDKADWTASWISDGKPTPECEEDMYKEDPAPLFRNEFDVEKPIVQARLYITGLGYYEAYLNGEKIGDAVLTPAWTAYAKRVLYNTFDVTKLLKDGRNCMGVMLGNGWYNPLPMRMWGWLNIREHLTIGRPRLIGQLEIQYTDGTSQTVVTDASWKVTEGPILRNNIYLGEIYDARKEVAGWNNTGLDDSNWRQAAIVTEPLGQLRAQPIPPIKVTATLNPVKITEPNDGVYIFDMGQNFAGWVKLKVAGPAGTRVKLRYGELLYPDGRLNVMTSVCGQIKPGVDEKLTGARAGRWGPGAPTIAEQSDTYILKGSGQETFRSHFAFHGFRYVEVTGYPGKLTLNTLEGQRLNTAVEQTGSFACSNDLLNRIQKMVEWTLFSTLNSVQADPTRERIGYGADFVVSADVAMLNTDMSTFYAKTVYDLYEAARPNGGMTECAPYVGIADFGLGGETGPIGWQLAHPFLQLKLYRYYGNERILREQYETTKRLIEFLRSKAKDHIIDVGIGDHESLTPKVIPLNATAFYYHHVKLLSEIAQILGQNEDANRYSELTGEIKQVFIKKFLEKGTGKFGTGTQSCQAFALFYDLVPEDERQAAIDVLAERIQSETKIKAATGIFGSKDLEEEKVVPAGHLTTGMFGTKFMLDVLSDIGRADLAYTMVNQKTFPGWGYMLEKGATTMWEHWAFSDFTFLHNLTIFASVGEWLYEAPGGINLDSNAVGFDKIIIRPQVVGDLTWVKSKHESVRGPIVSNWKLDGDTFQLDVKIPANTTATIYIPTKDTNGVTESGKPAGESEGVRFIRTENGAVVYQVGSGSYSFTAKGVKPIGSSI